MQHLGKPAADLAQSLKHLTGSVRASTEAIEASKNYARILLGCYRMNEVADPDVYSRAVVAILAKFPVAVQLAVIDPTTGLPSKSKWLPTTSEILTACNDEQRRQDTVARYAAMQRATPFKGLEILPKVICGTGGPGTVYTAKGFAEAVARHGPVVGRKVAGA